MKNLLSIALKYTTNSLFLSYKNFTKIFFSLLLKAKLYNIYPKIFFQRKISVCFHYKHNCSISFFYYPNSSNFFLRNYFTPFLKD